MCQNEFSKNMLREQGVNSREDTKALNTGRAVNTSRAHRRGM